MRLCVLLIPLEHHQAADLLLPLPMTFLGTLS
jgi:hypothetical protein